MKRALIPGTFDPITSGHFDVIARASQLFDEVIVAPAASIKKSPLFTLEERVAFIEQATADLPCVKVAPFDGLLVDFAKEMEATAVVKGLRAITDFEYEFQMALANRKLYAGAETVFLTTTSENMYLSSSVVKQIAAFGGDISHFVPPEILDMIVKRLVKEKLS